MKNKKRVIFVSIIIILIAVAGLYATYAINVYMEEGTPSEYDMALNFELSGNLTKTLTVEAGKTKVFDIDITNPYSDSIKYGIAYTLNSPTSLPDGVIIAQSSISEDPAVGTITANDTVSVSIVIVNESTSNITLSLDVINGYKNGGNLILETGQVLIEDVYQFRIKKNGIILDLTLNGTEGDNGWYKSNVTVNVTPTVDEGVTISKYRYELMNVEGSTPTEQTSTSYTITNEGSTTRLCVTAITTDSKEAEFCTGNIKIDKTAPTAPTISYNESYDLVATGATDNLISGSELRYQFTGNTPGNESTGSGIYIIDDSFTTTGLTATAVVKDLAGNSAQAQKQIKVSTATSGNVTYKNVYVCSLDNKGYSTNDEAVANCQTGENGTAEEVTVYQCSVNANLESTDYDEVAASCVTTQQGSVTTDNTYYASCDSGYSLNYNETECTKSYSRTETETYLYQCDITNTYSYSFGPVTSEILQSPCSTQHSWECSSSRVGQTFIWCHTNTTGNPDFKVSFGSDLDACNRDSDCLEDGKCTTDSSGNYVCWHSGYEKRSKTCNSTLTGSSGVYDSPSTSTSGSSCDSGDYVSSSTSGSCSGYTGDSCSSNKTCTETTSYSCEDSVTPDYDTGYYCDLTGKWTSSYPTCQKTVSVTPTPNTKYQCSLDGNTYDDEQTAIDNCSTYETGNITSGNKYYCDVNQIAYDDQSTATTSCKSCSTGNLYNGRCYS